MKTPSIALQLYTLRDALDTDFAGTIARIAAMGYEGVETAFFPEGLPPSEARRRIADAGLAICSAHASLPVGETRDPALALARDLDVDTLVWHGWPEDPRYATSEGVTHLITAYNEAARIAADNGLRLGLHNHWWEFRSIEGVRTYDRLKAECDPRLLFELDVYWAAVAGADPVAELSALAGRAPLVHLKDGPAVPDAPKTAVGEGVLPMEKIVAATTAEWWIVELDDCATDRFDAVAASRRFLKGIV